MQAVERHVALQFGREEPNKFHSALWEEKCQVKIGTSKGNSRAVPRTSCGRLWKSEIVKERFKRILKNLEYFP